MTSGYRSDKLRSLTNEDDMKNYEDYEEVVCGKCGRRCGLSDSDGSFDYDTARGVETKRVELVRTTECCDSELWYANHEAMCSEQENGLNIIIDSWEGDIDLIEKHEKKISSMNVELAKCQREFGVLSELFNRQKIELTELRERLEKFTSL